MDDATLLPFDLPAVARKKLTVAFDGGDQSSDAGVLLLRAAEKKIGIIARMAAALTCDVVEEISDLPPFSTATITGVERRCDPKGSLSSNCADSGVDPMTSDF